MIILTSLLLPINNLRALKTTINNSFFTSDLSHHIISDYSVLFGEYPNARTCKENEETGAWNQECMITDRIKAFYTTFNLSRGKTYEYDCSFESKNCFVPSPIIIKNTLSSRTITRRITSINEGMPF